MTGMQMDKYLQKILPTKAEIREWFESDIKTDIDYSSPAEETDFDEGRIQDL